jgi:hypothetical protein
MSELHRVLQDIEKKFEITTPTIPNVHFVNILRAYMFYLYRSKVFHNDTLEDRTLYIYARRYVVHYENIRDKILLHPNASMTSVLTFMELTNYSVNAKAFEQAFLTWKKHQKARGVSKLQSELLSIQEALQVKGISDYLKINLEKKKESLYSDLKNVSDKQMYRMIRNMVERNTMSLISISSYFEKDAYELHIGNSFIRKPFKNENLSHHLLLDPHYKMQFYREYERATRNKFDVIANKMIYSNTWKNIENDISCAPSMMSFKKILNTVQQTLRAVKECILIAAKIENNAISRAINEESADEALFGEYKILYDSIDENFDFQMIEVQRDMQEFHLDELESLILKAIETMLSVKKLFKVQFLQTCRDSMTKFQSTCTSRKLVTQIEKRQDREDVVFDEAGSFEKEITERVKYLKRYRPRNQPRYIMKCLKLFLVKSGQLNIAAINEKLGMLYRVIAHTGIRYQRIKFKEAKKDIKNTRKCIKATIDDMALATCPQYETSVQNSIDAIIESSCKRSSVNQQTTMSEKEHDARRKHFFSTLSIRTRNIDVYNYMIVRFIASEERITRCDGEEEQEEEDQENTSFSVFPETLYVERDLLECARKELENIATYSAIVSRLPSIQARPQYKGEIHAITSYLVKEDVYEIGIEHIMHNIAVILRRDWGQSEENIAELLKCIQPYSYSALTDPVFKIIKRRLLVYLMESLVAKRRIQEIAKYKLCIPFMERTNKVSIDSFFSIFFIHLSHEDTTTIYSNMHVFCAWSENNKGCPRYLEYCKHQCPDIRIHL